MRESGYYPPGAEFDENAPYNEEFPEEVDVEVTISQSLSKTVSTPTSDYITNGYDYDFSEVDANEIYEANHYTITELLDEFKDLLYDKITQLSRDSKAHKNELVKYNHLLKEVEDWETDELEIFIE